jgi:hypothetical protein
LLAFDDAVLDQFRQAADVVEMAMGNHKQIEFERRRPEDCPELVRNGPRRPGCFPVAGMAAVDQDFPAAFDHDDAIAVNLRTHVEQVQLHGRPLNTRARRQTAPVPHPQTAGRL